MKSWPGTEVEAQERFVGQVNVTINGKHYRMACDDGEEPYLTGLAERLNATIEALRERFGEIGDQRLTVMAALTFADQSAEAGRRIASLERQIAETEASRSNGADREAEDAAGAIRALAAAAERIEALAGKVGGATDVQAAADADGHVNGG